MPYKEYESQKIYHTIGEVAAMFGVNTSLIRFWENEFDILKPQKNKKGNRLFTNEDIENLRIIHTLVKEQGFTLQGAKEKLKHNKDELGNKQKIIQSLEKLKSFLIQIKEEL